MDLICGGSKKVLIMLNRDIASTTASSIASSRDQNIRKGDLELGCCNTRSIRNDTVYERNEVNESVTL